MDRFIACYSIFILLTIVWVVATVTGFLLFINQLEYGCRALGRTLILGIPRKQWIAIHNYSSIAFTILGIAHLLINWRWVVNATKTIFSSKSRRR
ncbi:MAG: hypothetical protein DRO39_02845 [Thermoprotei archaeon]|nr:MAG: hypothetical protein DRO39_02845 [Thermoprotei archaeon]